MCLRIDGRKTWHGDILSKQVTVATAGQVVSPYISLGVELYLMSQGQQR